MGAEYSARMSPHRNDWRRTVALFALTSLVESLAFGHLSAFTPLYLRQLHVVPGAIPFWTGLLSATAFVIGLPLLPFWGVWADRHGRKLIIIRSSVFAALIYACSAASRDVWMLAGSRLLGGFVFGNTGIMMALQSDITPRERLGTAVALISAGSPVGMAVGPYAGGLVAERWGIRALLYADAALTMLVVVALAILLREEPAAFPAPASTWEGVLHALRGILHNPAVAALFGTVFLVSLGMSMGNPYVPILVERIYGAKDVAPKIGLVLTVAGIAMAVSTPLWGRIGDRRGHLETWRLCIAVTGVALCGQALARSLWSLGGWRALQGVCQGGLGALAVVLLAFYTPRDRRASVMNLSLLPQQLAWFLGPLAGAGLSGVALTAPFWGGAVALALGGAASMRLPVPKVMGDG